MATNVRDLHATEPERPDRPVTGSTEGLSPDELKAEQAGDLPEREAMSILDVGGLDAGLPSPADIAGQFGSLVPPGTGPVEGPIDPIEMAGQLPVDITGQLPTGTVPIGTLPMGPPDDGGLIGIPEQPDTGDDEILA
jgi:hypothetical protein